ncbi:endospore germination permease [Paenibacillus cremeus]|uniref:GerAB/ArcD/ProY family transporter n=1 Tax=Paenibacillus cremeus TaxID=2163881 RepID=A0A559K9V0_9BACL|nr:endospore germination permease [Paenibacillus cremeus]TVY08905.1 GerAB/ArcD/ProY family transporter [Paenibacillus cremeus]
MNNQKITALQMGMLMIMTVGLVNHVTLLPLLLDAAKKDSWISIIFTVPLCILWVTIPFYIMKKTKQTNLVQWLKTSRLNWFKPVFIGIFFLYMTINMFITLREVITWTKITYLPQTPMLLTCSTLLLLCMYAASKGIKAIAIAAGILLPFVWCLGYFVMSSNFQVKRYSLLFPLFTTGSGPILLCMTYVGASMLEIIIVLLFQHHIKEDVKWWHLAVVLFLLGGLTLGPLMGAIAAFGYEAVKLKYPAYEQWRLVQLGAFVSHVDFLSIYQWISGAFIRISLSLYLLIDLLQLQNRKSKMIGYGLFGLAMLFLMVVVKIPEAIYSRLIKDFYLAVFFCILPLSLVLFVLVYVKTKRKGMSS